MAGGAVDSFDVDGHEHSVLDTCPAQHAHMRPGHQAGQGQLANALGESGFAETPGCFGFDEPRQRRLRLEANQIGLPYFRAPGWPVSW